MRRHAALIALSHDDRHTPETFRAAYRQLAEFHHQTWERLGLTRH